MCNCSISPSLKMHLPHLWSHWYLRAQIMLNSSVHKTYFLKKFRHKKFRHHSTLYWRSYCSSASSSSLSHTEASQRFVLSICGVSWEFHVLQHVTASTLAFIGVYKKLASYFIYIT